MNMKKAFCIIGVLAGIWISVMGFILADTDYNHGGYAKEIKFGGDYYTEQYAVTRDVAINTSHLGYLLEYFCRYFGRAIGGFGIAITCFFGYKLFEKNIAVQTQINHQQSDELPDL